MATSVNVQIDPITTEIIRSAFTAAADEMNATLIRSAYTPVIYEMKDCSVALLDADTGAWAVGRAADLPRQPRDLHATDGGDVRPGRLAARRRLDHERLVPDRHPPQRHDGLRSDLPRRRVGRFRGVPRALARRRSQGPGRPDGLDSIYQEGIRLGPTKVVEGGMQRPDVTDLLGRNSRFSYPAIGDLGAQIACARTGQDRLAGDHRTIWTGDNRRGAKRDLRPDRTLRARGRGGDPGWRLLRRGVPRRRRQLDRSVLGPPLRSRSVATR